MEPEGRAAEAEDARRQSSFEFVVSMRERTASMRDALERSRASMTARARLAPKRAAITSAARWSGRQPPRAGPEARRSAGGAARTASSFASQAAYVKQLREQLAATAAALAVTEEQVARVNDNLAATHPGRAQGYLHIAEIAREHANMARQAERMFRGELPEHML